MNPFNRNLIKRYFSKDDLKSFGKTIGWMEERTSAEIRLKIISGIKKEFAADVYKQAVWEFEKEGMTKTKDQTGVLILIALEDRKFQILADKGIMAKVKQEILDRAAAIIGDGFKIKKQREALHMAIGFLGGMLGELFPRKPGDKNELPNNVVVDDGKEGK